MASGSGILGNQMSRSQETKCPAATPSGIMAEGLLSQKLIQKVMDWSIKAPEKQLLLCGAGPSNPMQKTLYQLGSCNHGSGIKSRPGEGQPRPGEGQPTLFGYQVISKHFDVCLTSKCHFFSNKNILNWQAKGQMVLMWRFPLFFVLLCDKRSQTEQLLVVYARQCLSQHNSLQAHFETLLDLKSTVHPRWMLLIFSVKFGSC